MRGRRKGKKDNKLSWIVRVKIKTKWRGKWEKEEIGRKICREKYRGERKGKKNTYISTYPVLNFSNKLLGHFVLPLIVLWTYRNNGLMLVGQKQPTFIGNSTSTVNNTIKIGEKKKDIMRGRKKGQRQDKWGLKWQKYEEEKVERERGEEEKV